MTHKKTLEIGTFSFVRVIGYCTSIRMGFSDPGSYLNPQNSIHDCLDT